MKNLIKLSFFIFIFVVTACTQLSTTPVVEQSPILPRLPAAEIKNLLETETCSANRNYLEEKLSTLGPELRGRRNTDPDDIPSSCVLLSMRRQHRAAEVAPSNSFANCSSDKSAPSRGVLKPCVTDNYFNSIYNAYTDVMNCLGMDQKFYFPQVVFESGFHLNAIAHNNFDAGLGQYTKNGVLHIMKTGMYPNTIRALFNNDKPSCNRIAQYLGDISKEMAEVSNRCAFIDPPKNPYKSLLFYALHHLRDENQLKFEIEKRGLEKKIVRAGWTNVDLEKLIKTLSLLSYNAGIEGTVRNLNNYIDSRLKMGEVIGAKHFDFTKDLNFMRGRINKKKAKAGNFKRLTFAEYLWIWHTSYMSEISYIKNHFDRVLGPVCTSDHYLKF